MSSAWQTILTQSASTTARLLLCLSIVSCTGLGADPAAAPSPETSPETSSATSPADAPVAAAPQRPLVVAPVPVVSNLEHPWGMAWLPDGAMLVTERPGRLRIIRNGQLDPTPIAGVPEVLALGQGGLLDVAVHPNFAENQWVYFTYAHGSAEANQTRVARAQFDGQALRNWTVLLEVERDKEQGQHFGSRLAWLPDTTLLVSIGDGGNPPIQLDGELIRNQAQSLTVRLGKIVRLNDDGSIPENNPFVGVADADPAIWSYGHRNIQGLAVDAETGQVWASEHGARGGDELNWVRRGENYGWPLVTYSEEYSGGEISPNQTLPGMVDPQFVWPTTKAPSGLVVYRGDRYAQWQGQILAGGLVSQAIQRFVVGADGAVQEAGAIAIGQRVRQISQGPDGYLYVLTDHPNGQLLRLDPQP